MESLKNNEMVFDEAGKFAPPKQESHFVKATRANKARRLQQAIADPGFSRAVMYGYLAAHGRIDYEIMRTRAGGFVKVYHPGTINTQPQPEFSFSVWCADLARRIRHRFGIPQTLRV